MNVMDIKRHFQLKCGVTVVADFESDWATMRQRGNELADQLGHVALCAYNEKMNRWEHMGTFHGKMRYTNKWGDHSEITPDFSSLRHVREGGEVV